MIIMIGKSRSSHNFHCKPDFFFPPSSLFDIKIFSVVSLPDTLKILELFLQLGERFFFFFFSEGGRRSRGKIFYQSTTPLINRPYQSPQADKHYQ